MPEWTEEREQELTEKAAAEADYTETAGRLHYTSDNMGGVTFRIVYKGGETLDILNNTTDVIYIGNSIEAVSTSTPDEGGGYSRIALPQGTGYNGFTLQGDSLCIKTNARGDISIVAR